MKIALMSDSHDNMPALFKAVDFCNIRKVDHVLHAGDLVAPFVNRALRKLEAPLTIVYGNNDGERAGLNAIFRDRIFDPPHKLTLGGRHILMLHDPILLDVLRDSGRFDLILYGHVHEIENVKGACLVVNPGELCGWLTGKSTLALWDTEANEAEIITL